MTATVDDLVAGWRTLDDQERIVAATLLARAWALIASAFPSVKALPESSEGHVVAVAVACQMARRAMGGADDKAVSESLTAGPFQQSFTYRPNDGALTILERERTALQEALRGPRPAAVSMRSEGL